MAMLLTPCRVIADNTLALTVKSAYIFNFIQFIDWPEQALGPSPNPVKICMIGNDQFAAALATLSGRHVKGRPIAVAPISADHEALTSCQVVVIDQTAAAQLPQLLEQLAGANVLTVSDIPQFAHRGGAIGFVIDQGKVRIEINPRATQQAGLRVSANLLEVARIVQ
jgi:hypothetical protein